MLALHTDTPKPTVRRIRYRPRPSITLPTSPSTSSSKLSSVRSNSIALDVYSAAFLALPSLKRRNSDNVLEFDRSELVSRSTSLFKIPVPLPRVSKRDFGSVRAYASVTHPGKTRLINEDRVMAMCPVTVKRGGRDEVLSNCSMFAVVDGTNGSKCAEFLQDNLFKLITDEPAFMTDPSEALRHAFRKADKLFLESVTKLSKAGKADRSGASVIVLIIVEDSVYLANLGNCRAIMSGGGGFRSFNLYREHTLNDEYEKKRVIKAGGKVQRSLYETLKHMEKGTNLQSFRIYPGDISLTRAFGHFDAKSEATGGNSKVVLSQPDIRHFRLTHEHDCILIGSSGTFRAMTNKEAIHNLWRISNTSSEEPQERLGAAMSEMLQLAVDREADENVSGLVVAFEGYIRHCRLTHI